MGRGKVEMKRIANKINRQVTFSKRKGGLMKKANEISVLCDAEVALIVFSHKGKLFQYSSTHSCMEGILDRYERYSFSGREHVVNETKLSGSWTMEYTKMKAKMELLQENIRHYMGEDLESLSMKNLQHLEQQLDNARKHIRSKKNQLLYQSISDLQKREKTMEDQNSMLANKIEENEKTKANLQEQQNHGLNSSSFYMAQPLLPNLDIGGIYQEGGGRRNHELDLTREPLFLTNSCQLGFFPSH